MCLAIWQADMLPTRLRQSHNSANTIPATGILGEVQEEKPSMTRRECLGNNHMHSLSEDCKPTRMDRHTDFLFPIYLKRKRKWSMQVLQQREIVVLFSDEWCPHQPSSSSRRRANWCALDTKRSLSNRTASMKGKCITHCTSACSTCS